MSDPTEHLKELLQGFDTISVRRMFGGYGVFRDQLVFGLFAGDVLYLKADAELEPRFRAANLDAFE